MASTQTTHPWRAVVRTLFAVVIAYAVLLPIVVSTFGIPVVGAVAIGLAVASGITRLLAVPGVDAFLQKYAKWLASEPAEVADKVTKAANTLVPVVKDIVTNATVTIGDHTTSTQSS